MLAKMPSHEKSKTETPALNYRLLAGIITIFALLGLAAGYTIFPMLQTPKVVVLAPNLTNNTTSYSASPIKHTIKYTNSTVQKSNQTKTSTKNTAKSNSSTQSNSVSKTLQSSRTSNA
jgi:hypothetical protein